MTDGRMKKTLNADAQSLLRCIITYTEHALEQLQNGGGVSAGTYLTIQRAKNQTGAALAAVLEDMKND